MTARPESQPRRIVVVDDNELDRQLAVRSAADQTGLIWVDSVSMQAAPAAIAAGERPALVMLSCSMRTGGFELLRWIRTHETLWELPVIVAVEANDPTEATHAYREGANGVVRKPIDPGEGPELWRRIVDYWIRLNVGN